MMSKKNVLIWAFAAFAGMLFAVAPNVQGDGGGRVRLDGAWLVTSPAGIRGVETITALDPSGRRSAVRVCFGHLARSFTSGFTSQLTRIRSLDFICLVARW